ncbi:MAG: hypothetical protein KJ069_10480 [Anaerolineae bacterium]|nr:hypothetical protein [Anaerolineae bacterium]
MIRPFHLRDVALVHRLSEHGVSLHTESALTKNINPVRGALFGIVGGDFPTYVWKSENRTTAGFIQLGLVEGSPLAQILFVGATNDTAVPDSVAETNGNTAVTLPDAPHVINEQVWLPLLDQAVIEAGRRGIVSLKAEVDELGPELPILRRAGFVVYTRQDIWAISEFVPHNGAELLRPRQESDDWDIHLLYANTVPRLVQMVEPLPPPGEGTGWVLREDGELAAFVHIHDGPAATWMRLFVHPNAEARVEEILTAVLHIRPPRLAHPVYCCVRRYQSWIQNALARTSFTLWGSQAVMVKHTVHHVQKSVPDLSALLEAQPVSPTTPMIRNWQSVSAKEKKSNQL